MGLDMYLSRLTYVKQWSYDTDENKFDVRVERGGKLYTKINPKKISYIVEEVAYWRKANQIHNWFVQNCQGGVDECQTAHVSVEQLETLLATCHEVMAHHKKHPTDHSKSQELLPVSKGFFFGSGEYDEYYYADIDETITMLSEILGVGTDKKHGFDLSEFEYKSSW